MSENEIKTHYFHNPYEAIPARKKELDYVYSENLKIGFDYIHEIIGRPTFREYFLKSNEYIQSEICSHIIVIANQDIIFPKEFITNIKKFAKRDTALCLSTWDFVDKKWTLRTRAASQDIWVFLGEIKIPESCDFTMGVSGCDNRIMYELNKVGYIIKNPAISIKTFHLHKTISGKKGKIPRPYKMIAPHK